MKHLVLCLLLMFGLAQASPLFDNDIHHTVFEDNSVLVYQCLGQTSGIVNIAFLDPEGKVHPFVVRCGPDT